MQCTQVQKLLSAYYDRELASDVFQLVARHLQRCPRCVADLAVFRRLSVLVKQSRCPQVLDWWPTLEPLLEADARAASAALPAAGTAPPGGGHAMLPLSASSVRETPRSSAG